MCFLIAGRCIVTSVCGLSTDAASHDSGRPGRYVPTYAPFVQRRRITLAEVTRRIGIAAVLPHGDQGSLAPRTIHPEAPFAHEAREVRAHHDPQLGNSPPSHRRCCPPAPRRRTGRLANRRSHERSWESMQPRPDAGWVGLNRTARARGLDARRPARGANSPRVSRLSQPRQEIGSNGATCC